MSSWITGICLDWLKNMIANLFYNLPCSDMFLLYNILSADLKVNLSSILLFSKSECYRDKYLLYKLLKFKLIVNAIILLFSSSFGNIFNGDNSFYSSIFVNFIIKSLKNYLWFFYVKDNFIMKLLKSFLF